MFTPKEIELIRSTCTAYEPEDWYSEDQFEEFFDEIYDPIQVGPYTYPASQLLKSTDPVAFRQDFLNWRDNELTNDETLVYIDGNYFLHSEIDVLIDADTGEMRRILY